MRSAGVSRTVACFDRDFYGCTVIDKFHYPIGGKRFVTLHGGFGEEHGRICCAARDKDSLYVHPFGQERSVSGCGNNLF